MSHETHDQNQGMQTPDTAPSRGRVLALAILMYAIVACAGYFFIYQFGNSVNEATSLEPTPTLVPNSTYQISAYLAPSSSPLLTPQQTALANMRIATNTVEIATLLGTYPEIQIIYLDPRLIADADQAFLQRQLASGKIIVALKSDHNAFARLLGVEPAVENISDEEQSRRLLWVSVIGMRDDGVFQEVQGYDQFEALLQTMAEYVSSAP
ncbi:MAG: hypothetical protein QNJ45_11320 [Ardenticatenaceae bacterium]|nr:hypothetical protein [Ardenticatenaceae bacterium]